MSLRLIEILVPAPSEGAIDAVLEEQTTLATWTTRLPEDSVRISVLTSGDATKAVMEALDERVSDITDARVLLLSVEATLPRPEEIQAEEAAKTPSQPGEEDEEDASAATGRLSTAELYQDVLGMSQMSSYYIGLVLLSTLVAAMGLLRGSTVVIIGAMVIAPLIGPNVGLSLATTLADGRLARESLVSGALGMGAAVLGSLLLGTWLPIDPAAPELASRTAVSLSDVALALAAGGAAVLSLTVGVSTALVGVMVAVALLPPAVAAGLFAGAGYLEPAALAGMLVTVNLICINLAGVVTFLVQGVRPNRYWEAEQARRATATAILVWTALLALLVFLIWRVFGLQLVPA